MEFNTLEKVKELFKNVDCEGNENCYFVTFKNYSKSKSGTLGGMAGGIVGAMAK